MCKFHINNLIQICLLFLATSFTGNAQSSAGNQHSMSKIVTEYSNYEVTVDHNSSNEVYSLWFLNNERLIEDSLVAINGKTLSISNIQLSHEGTYSHLLYDSSDAVISTFEFYLSVEPCSRLSPGEALITTIPCMSNQADSVNISLAQYDTVNYPLDFWLDDKMYTAENGAEFVIEDLSPGVYDLVFRDAKGCEGTVQRYLRIEKEECDFVFTPNGDGLGDTFFINLDGKLEIVNQAGEIIRELQGPVEWDGQDELGKLVVPALYFIWSEDHTQLSALTVLR